MYRLLTVAALALAVPAAPLFAQEVPDLAARSELARKAEETGRLMADVQDATALAQRQYAGMTEGAITAGYMGAIAMPGDAPGVWDTVIVGRREGAGAEGEDAPLVALAEYEISNGEILSEVLHLPADAPLLDGQASAMAQARMFAPRAVIAAGNRSFCTSGEADVVAFSTIVLPPREDGSFDAYLLNGPIEAGAIPLGKHFRVAFDAFGIDGTPVLLTDTCEVVTWDTSADTAMNVYVTDYRGGTAPNEIHAFISTLLPMSLGVVTGDEIWPMAGGMIAPPVPAAEAGYVRGE
ncbi:hypothetical protein [Aurantiacibacter luteus]|uniref:Uncharacterized protein n=1 Tax=Aurantiacibacter luteus TaxID=1581420 RepID=A0A0G9MSY4_9SPHN|nr:hypothetical protein [Aurantiacibacter luteus]KLE33882.1 hypothetical protein AAW00_12505 [Aurantiacibacter luteus]